MKKYIAIYTQADGDNDMQLKFEAANLAEAKKYANLQKNINTVVSAKKAFEDKLRSKKAAGAKNVFVPSKNAPRSPIVKITVKELKPVKIKKTSLYEF